MLEGKWYSDDKRKKDRRLGGLREWQHQVRETKTWHLEHHRCSQETRTFVSEVRKSRQ